MKTIIKTKTFWTGIAGVVGAAGGYFTGAMPLPEAAQLAVGSLLAVFLRHGIAKGQK